MQQLISSLSKSATIYLHHLWNLHCFESNTEMFRNIYGNWIGFTILLDFYGFLIKKNVNYSNCIVFLEK